jgi:hypothetical protein
MPSEKPDSVQIATSQGAQRLTGVLIKLLAGG